MKIGITGANGYLGGLLVNHLKTKHQITAYQRKEEILDGVTVAYFDLNKPEDFNFKGLDVLIHLAHIMYGQRNPQSDNINLIAAQKIIDLSHEHQFKVIYASSLSSHPEAQSHYGKTKLAIEEKFSSAGHLSLKLGLVLGHGGLYHSMGGIIKKSNYIPAIGGGKQPMQTLYYKDFLKAIDNSLAKSLTGIIHLAEYPSFPIKELFKKIAHSEGRNLTIIDVPYALVEIPALIIDKLKLNLPFSRENLLGLKCLKEFDTRIDQKILQFQFTPYDKAIELLSKEKPD